MASVPETENCCVIPVARLIGMMAGDKDNETVSDVVSIDDPVIPLNTAVMMVDPVDVPAVANPFEAGVLLIPAMFVSDDVHVALVVRFCVLPFE